MSNPLIKISVSQADATLVQTCTITAGMQSTPTVRFTFSDEWDNLGKMAVVRAGDSAVEVLVVNNQITIPAESVAVAGVNLIVGVYGANTSIVIPTVWCSVGEILDGTTIEDADNNADPTPSDIQQMLDYAAEIAATAETLEEYAILDTEVVDTGANQYGVVNVDAELVDIESEDPEEETPGKILKMTFENMKGNGITSITYSNSGEYKGRINIATDANPSGTNYDALIEPIAHFEEVIDEAEASALVAEGYALGTQDGEPSEIYAENNAFYFASLAAESEEAADLAQSAAEDAQEAAEIAQGKAEDAQTAAETAAGEAAASETVASTKAGEASDSASTASDAALTAEGHAESALNAKTAAETAQGLAETAKTAAQGYASDASGYASAASGYATNASNSATAASGSANSASGSATSASTNALKAEGFAVGEQNGTEVSSGSPYYHNNAEYYAGEAADSATDAQAAQEAAETAAATFETDTTLTVSGKAADAKVTGDEIGYLKGALDNTSSMPYYDALPDYYTDTHNGSKIEIIKNVIKVTKTSSNSTYTYTSLFGKRFLGANITFENYLTDDDFVNIDFGNVNNFGIVFWRVVDKIVSSSPNTIYLATKNPSTGVISSINTVNNGVATERYTNIFSVLPQVQENKNFALIFRRTNSNDQQTIKLYFEYQLFPNYTGNYEPFSKIASKAYNAGDYFQIGTSVYRATQSISQGGTITPNTNCIATYVGDELKTKVPPTRTVNSKALSSDVTLTAEDIQYDGTLSSHTSGSVGKNLSSLKTDVDGKALDNFYTNTLLGMFTINTSGSVNNSTMTVNKNKIALTRTGTGSSYYAWGFTSTTETLYRVSSGTATWDSIMTSLYNNNCFVDPKIAPTNATSLEIMLYVKISGVKSRKCELNIATVTEGEGGALTFNRATLVELASDPSILAIVIPNSIVVDIVNGKKVCVFGQMRGSYESVRDTLYAELNFIVKNNYRVLSAITGNHEKNYIATKNYSAGDLLTIQSGLYKATASIASGEDLINNTNISATTVEALLASLS